MTKKYFLIPLLLIGAMTLIVGCSNGNGVQAQTRSLGTMSGTVISILNEQPIADRAVAIEIWSVPIESSGPENNAGGLIKILAYCDVNGQYHVADVPVGRIWMRASANDFKRSPPKYWALSPNAKGTLDFTLYPGEGDQYFDPLDGWDVVQNGDGQEAFDPCNPGFIREGPHDKKKCGDKG